MCMSVKPEKFLAVAFKESKKDKLKYSELTAIRQALDACTVRGECLEVDWDHDAVNYALGFFSRVFTSESDGIRCNVEVMQQDWPFIVDEMDTTLHDEMNRCVRKAMASST